MMTMMMRRRRRMVSIFDSLAELRRMNEKKRRVFEETLPRETKSLVGRWVGRRYGVCTRK
jgi:hypothetical protein